MLVITTFKEIKIGVKFFYHNMKYIKTINPQNGKKGATNLYTGEVVTDCNGWHDIQVEIDPKKKEFIPKRKILNMVVTDVDRGYEPIIIKITEEQRKLVDIMYDNDMLYDTLNINYLDEPPVIDATEE